LTTVSQQLRLLEEDCSFEVLTSGTAVFDEGHYKTDIDGTRKETELMISVMEGLVRISGDEEDPIRVSFQDICDRFRRNASCGRHLLAVHLNDATEWTQAD